jgi:hypothetical protein
MIAPSRLTGRGGIVSVVPAIGHATDAKPENMLAKLARSYTDKDEHGTFLDQTRELVTKLRTHAAHDIILIDARAGLNEGTAASILGLGGLVLLFGIDTPQTFRGYSYAFAQLRKFLDDNREQSWRGRLQMVLAEGSVIVRITCMQIGYTMRLHSTTSTPSISTSTTIPRLTLAGRFFTIVTFLSSILSSNQSFCRID